MDPHEIKEYLLSLEESEDRSDYDRFMKKAGIDPYGPTIHIVGSNGKSATARYLSHAYALAGYKVGLLTNLFLDSPLECVCINEVPAAEEAFRLFLDENAKPLKKNPLSMWETLCAFAFDLFKKEKIDIAIVESNLGGDSDPSFLEEEDQRLVVFTSLSLEHTSFLGTTLSQIALNKISLLKDSAPLLSASFDEDITALLKETAQSVDSRYFIVDAFHFEEVVDGGYQFTYQPYKNVKIPAKARYLIKDASLAIEAIQLLQKDFPVKEETVYSAFSSCFIPMCLEVKEGVIYDNNSNVESSESLVESLHNLAAAPIHLIFAAEEESNIAAMLPFLSNFCQTLTLTSLPGNHKVRGEGGYIFYTEDFPFVEDPDVAFKVLRETYPNDFILFSGSKDFVREMRRRHYRGK